MKHIKPVIFVLLTLIISDAVGNISSAGYMFGAATYITALLGYATLSIFIFIYLRRRSEIDVPKHIKYLYNFWILIIVFNLLRAFFIAETYWDWKALLLSYMFFSFIPLAFYFGEDIETARTVFKIIVKYIFPFGFLLIPIGMATNPELYSRIMIPISLFILFTPYIKFKKKILVFLVMIVSILMVLSFRSNIIKNGVSILLITMYYFRNQIWVFWLRTFHLILFAIPFIFFTLGVTGHYNVFEEMSNKNAVSISGPDDDENLLYDSRTFLYLEVLSSMDYTHQWLLGKSIVGSYRSDWFYDDGGAMKGKRYECEVGNLNILLKYGLLGVLGYFLLMFFVSLNAIKNSNNYLSKMLGIFIAFRWTYSFIEEYSQFDLNFFTVWIAIGFVSSNSFRNMTDEQLKDYFRIL